VVQGEAIEGILDTIRFQNENGFLIGQFVNASEDSFAALGTLLKPKVGVNYRLFGKWVENQRWGFQFQFSAYQSVEPKDVEAIYRYIVNTAKWVGPVVGRTIVQAYKENTLEVLRTSPERVARETRGITLARALEIQKAILENYELEQTIVELEKLLGGQGLKRTLPAEIAALWGPASVASLKENPYALTKLRGIGFLTADRLAINRFQINPTSMHRQRACIYYLLQQNEVSGNTWISMQTLQDQATKLISVNIIDGLREAVEKGWISLVGDMLAIPTTNEKEAYVANRLLELSACNSRKAGWLS